jgi:hypothetical protein
MAKATKKSERTENDDRDRLSVDVTNERARWEKAAGKLHMKLTPFVKLAVEEKIRRDGLT